MKRIFDKEFKNLLEKEMEKHFCLLPDGEFEYEVYADYYDSLSDKTVGEILSTNNPTEAFYSCIDNAFTDSGLQDICDISETIISDLRNKGIEFNEEEVENYITENVHLTLPYEHYLKQKVCVDICVDTGDGNYDYTLNCLPPCYYSYYGEKFSDKASIVWLAKNQGVKKSELKTALKAESSAGLSRFLKSIRNEVLNESSHLNVLVFLTKITLGELIMLNECINLRNANGHIYDATKRPYCGYIVIDKATTTGLFDPWSGAGSLLEIELEKDVRLPIRFIASALPDKGSEDYSVHEVYGVNSSLWEDGKIKIIHAPAKTNIKSA